MWPAKKRQFIVKVVPSPMSSQISHHYLCDECAPWLFFPMRWMRCFSAAVWRLHILSPDLICILILLISCTDKMHWCLLCDKTELLRSSQCQGQKNINLLSLNCLIKHYKYWRRLFDPKNWAINLVSATVTVSR